MRLSDRSKFRSDRKYGDIVKKLVTTILLLAGLIIMLGAGAHGQVIHPNTFFTSFADTTKASTFNDLPLVPGTIIQAFDPSGVYCGVDTVRLDSISAVGIFGYFSVYGDDPNTAGLDEGAETGEQITFKINGHDATVVAGDDTWTHQALKSVTLSVPASSVTIAMSGVNYSTDRVAGFNDTVHIQVDVRNDGSGLDYYGVNMSMSVPGSSGPFDWEALPPDTSVYAEAGEVVSIFFDVRVPTFSDSTLNRISYSIFSHLDTMVSVDSAFDISMALVDVEDGSDLLPAGFALDQNYPNPFNPTTTISFSLPFRSDVRLDIFNVLGRTMDIIELGQLSAGPHLIEYDASSLASGVYFYRLATEYASVSRKMTVLK